MKKFCLFCLSCLVALPLIASPFAHSIVYYEPGAGVATSFNSPLSVLGEPSRVTPGMFGGPVDPFAPPYLAQQLVSIGAGGSLTVQFELPVVDDPRHPFGLDFIVFGNNGFTITNGDFSGGGITDGTTFTFDPPGGSRVWVSEDGLTFFELIPPSNVAATVDGLFPTDGSGNFEVPVDPSGRDFAGLDLAGIRQRYAGSAGGTGFDLAWARNDQGNNAALARARYVRIDVLTGKVEVDGFAAVAPSGGANIVEDFADDPETHGWRRYGDSDLFEWMEDALAVTWDSSRTNSYFYKPLGQILSQSDDFTLTFDLNLNDIAIGTTPNQPYTFQIAVGFLNWSEATRSDFFRGSGVHPQYGARSIVEFNYFPDSGFGATVSPTVVSTNNQIAFGGGFPLELTTNDLFHIEMVYSSSNQVLRTSMTRNGQPFGLPPDQTLRDIELAGFPDFRVDTLAISSYNDGGQSPPEFAGSVVAHGTIDNLVADLPPSPVQDLTGNFEEGTWRMTLRSRIGYEYQLERTSDFVTWQTAGDAVLGTGAQLVLTDPLAAGNQFFYRIRLFKP